MTVDYAVMASDDNELYLDFWLPVSKLWKERIGITPVLLYFGDGSPSEEYGIVIKMDKNVSNLPLATCWARYWWVGQQGDKISIITDIDMLPFSKWYFNDQLKPFANDLYVQINPCIDTYSRLPSCYHVASGNTYKEALKLHDTFEVSYDNLRSKYYDNHTCYIRGGNNLWCYDEYHATELLLKFDRLVMRNRIGGQSGHRIDRTDWNYDIEKVKSGYYYDSHSIRPYKQHKEAIDKLINELI
jgi:hypothetical protein